MPRNNRQTQPSRAAGYAELIERYGLEVTPNWHRSLVAPGQTHRISTTSEGVSETYPSTHWPGDSLGNHLEFALKYDGTNLLILSRIFQAAPEKELLAYLKSKPTGKYSRRLWFFYEFLTGKTLPLKDLKQGNYVDALDPDEYYTLKAGSKVRRQRINDNLLGTRSFCPVIRRTKKLRAYESANLTKRCEKLVASYPTELLKRALSYLYTKETKSSFEIERIEPSASRTERFVALLELAEREDFCEKPRLIDLQNRIVDPRFQDKDYRTNQNYVGETIGMNQQKVHIACPKPEDVADLMAGLISAHQRMDSGGVSPVAHAAAVAYGFVFVHPFEDGNGRIHRFLIHNILARRKFTPNGVMFPVSAVMLKNPAEYDASLEALSKPLMSLVEFDLDDEGRMTVQNDTAPLYRYIDMTPQAESLFQFIEQTIDTELAQELVFLANYDRAKKAVQEIVDMPDRKIDLMIRFCLQNNGRLSAKKREKYFDFLSDEEVKQIEKEVQSAYARSSDSANQ